MNENAAIKIKDLSKKIFSPKGAVKNAFEKLSAEFAEGIISSIYSENEFPSKILLQTISGIIQPDSGTVRTNGNVIYIPAEPSSFPWLTVKENILFGVENKSENEINEIIGIVGLEGYEDHRCGNRSAGFRARIALGRAFVRKPAVIAVDAIFNGMDKRTKHEILELLIKINRETKQTFIVACGDIYASVFIADNFIAMNENGSLTEDVKVNFNAARTEALFASEEFAEIVRKVTLISKS